MLDASTGLKTTGSLNTEELLKAVLKSDDLPTLPTVASKLVALTSRDDVTLSDVADLVVQDVALCSKILKVVNSAFYSFPQQVGSITQAVSILGTNAVQSLVLSFSFLSINKGKTESQFDFDRFCERSLASAIVAKLLLGKVSGADTEEIFVSALLQNLGELILACTILKDYEKVVDQTCKNSGDSRDAEVSVLEVDHCLVGYEVAKHWNFPPSILLPILHHHDPLRYEGKDAQTRFSTRAIYLSDILVNIFYSDKPEDYYCQFQTEAAQLLGLNMKCIKAILDEAHTEIDKGAANFGLKVEQTRSVEEILQEANIRLGVLNLDYDQVNKELIKAKISLEKLAKDLQEKNKLLKTLADMDGLTGIYNNRYFQSALDKELNRTARNKNPLSLVLVDIDHFKRFNDDHGHLVGDFVLTEFSRVMGANLREYDVLARYGGEEFVVILPETTEENAFLVAEKLRSAVEEQSFTEGVERYRVTASFGIASIVSSAEDSLDKMDLIRMADEALYDAKKRGRNQVAVYSVKKKWYKFA